MVIAGEPSGDLQAALLLRELRTLRPEWSFFGIGGPRMVEQGFAQLIGIDELAVIGFAGVARNVLFFRRVFAQMEQAMRDRNPEAVILVDYPGFNLRFARRAKHRGTKVIYYIAPQIWAWGERRIETLRRCVDLLVALFPFEEEYFRTRGVNLRRVGHPLVDVVRPNVNRERFRLPLGISEDAQLIALLPGSRPGEVARHLPVMLAAVTLLKSRFPTAVPIVARAAGITEERIRSLAARSGAADLRITEDTYSTLAAADAAIIKSGTGTVECALLRTPFVVMYKTGTINYLIARRLVKTTHLAMVNLIAGKTIVPEFIQTAATPAHLAKAVCELLANETYRESMVHELDHVREKLGPPDGAGRAAQIIADFLEGTKIP